MNEFIFQVMRAQSALRHQNKYAGSYELSANWYKKIPH